MRVPLKCAKQRSGIPDPLILPFLSQGWGLRTQLGCGFLLWHVLNEDMESTSFAF